MNRTLSISAFALAAAIGATGASADTLNVVCSNEQVWCDLMAQNFQIDTGIDTAIVRKSTGEVLAQVRAEAGNPKVDVWWGGTGDPHLIAAAEDLTVATGVDTSGLLGWAQNMAEMTDGKAIGVHVGLLGMLYNTEVLEEKGLPAPACWRDLTKPEYKGEITVASPQSSGTAYTELATLVQLFGEDEAMQLLADIGQNVNQYTKSGSAPGKMAARGETTIAIGFMHDMVNLKKQGFPVEIVSPCEGTGYETGAVSVIKGTPNMDAAKKWVEYVISADAQSRGLEVGVYNIPSNPDAATDPEAPDMASVKLIDYDFATYGASDTRERLLERWEADVKSKGGNFEE
ncbi:ABC transporter substrate-binding protein [Tropicimonas isoalkanivorans]|uniref:Iron(III) transport system substrate-binding protein n=1 Tax=Tropicimonas isoalkanivorans TaxID=441112 RepID=A0A1I1DRV0_9RHOB|nr:ABC transporter substrate-binding protein [Tropicimonas isoalkanivorans]SFB77574.1 iron(III) transport system substrate-binding protein [Tropicimonas isoalkanivorans]